MTTTSDTDYTFYWQHGDPLPMSHQPGKVYVRELGRVIPVEDLPDVVEGNTCVFTLTWEPAPTPDNLDAMVWYRLRNGETDQVLPVRLAWGHTALRAQQVIDWAYVTDSYKPRTSTHPLQTVCLLIREPLRVADASNNSHTTTAAHSVWIDLHEVSHIHDTGEEVEHRYRLHLKDGNKYSTQHKHIVDMWLAVMSSR